IFIQGNEVGIDSLPDSVGMGRQSFHRAYDVAGHRNGWCEMVTAKKKHVPIRRHLAHVFGKFFNEVRIKQTIILEDEDTRTACLLRFFYRRKMAESTCIVDRPEMAEPLRNNNSFSIDSSQPLNRLDAELFKGLADNDPTIRAAIEVDAKLVWED